MSTRVRQLKIRVIHLCALGNEREPAGLVTVKESSGKGSKTPRGSLRNLRVSPPVLITVAVTLRLSNPPTSTLWVGQARGSGDDDRRGYGGGEGSTEGRGDPFATKVVGEADVASPPNLSGTTTMRPNSAEGVSESQAINAVTGREILGSSVAWLGTIRSARLESGHEHHIQDARLVAGASRLRGGEHPESIQTSRRLQPRQKAKGSPAWEVEIGRSACSVSQSKAPFPVPARGSGAVPPEAPVNSFSATAWHFSTHWGQGPKYPPGTCWIHWEYRQQVTPMCPVGKSWVY